MAGTHRWAAPAAKHRAERVPLAARVAAGTGLSPAVLGGVAAGTLSIAAGSLLPGLASSAMAVGDGSDAPGAQPAAATVAVAIPQGASYAAPSDQDLSRLRFCESTDRYSVDTGNGFYGAYQFDLSTWHTLGLDGMPQDAVPPLQDAAANALEQSRGWEPWPTCSSQLGLMPRRVHGIPATQVIATLDPTVAGKPATGPASVGTPGAPTFTTDAPPFSGRAFSIHNHAKYRADVRLWQERMSARGWALKADGYFGARSQAVARAFAAQKHLSDGFPGEVGATLWAAAWESPLS